MFKACLLAEKKNTTFARFLSNRIPISYKTDIRHQEQPASAIALHQGLDEQIETMMTVIDVTFADRKGYVAACNFCGEEASSRNMQNQSKPYHKCLKYL